MKDVEPTLADLFPPLPEEVTRREEDHQLLPKGEGAVKFLSTGSTADPSELVITRLDAVLARVEELDLEASSSIGASSTDSTSSSSKDNPLSTNSMSVASVFGDLFVRRLFFQLLALVQKKHFVSAHGQIFPENIHLQYRGDPETLIPSSNGLDIGLEISLADPVADSSSRVNISSSGSSGGSSSSLNHRSSSKKTSLLTNTGSRSSSEGEVKMISQRLHLHYLSPEATQEIYDLLTSLTKLVNERGKKKQQSNTQMQHQQFAAQLQQKVQLVRTVKELWELYRTTLQDSISSSSSFSGKQQQQQMLRPASRADDIWSLGVLLYELLTGEQLFEHSSPLGLMEIIIRFRGLRFPSTSVIPLAAQKLLLKCLQPGYEGRLRISAASIIVSDFLLNFARVCSNKKEDSFAGPPRDRLVELGQGSYGRVCEATLFGSIPVAVKMIRRNFHPSEVYAARLRANKGIRHDDYLASQEEESLVASEVKMGKLSSRYDREWVLALTEQRYGSINTQSTITGEDNGSSTKVAEVDLTQAYLPDGRKLPHGYSVQFYEHFETEQHFFLVSSLVKNAVELEKFWKQGLRGGFVGSDHGGTRKSLNVKQIQRAFAMMAVGLMRYAYDPSGNLRDLILVHRDVKLDNMLLSKSTGSVVQIDLGLAAAQLGEGVTLCTNGTMGNNNPSSSHIKHSKNTGKGNNNNISNNNNNMIVGTGYIRGGVGTPYYVAPEVLKGKAYNHMCDVWSLGVCLFRLLTERFPFSGNTVAVVFDKIKHKAPEWPAPDTQSSSRWNYGNPLFRTGKELVERMLEKDPTRRIRINEVLKSEFLYIGLSAEERWELGLPEHTPGTTTSGARDWSKTSHSDSNSQTRGGDNDGFNAAVRFLPRIALNAFTGLLSSPNGGGAVSKVPSRSSEGFFGFNNPNGPRSSFALDMLTLASPPNPSPPPPSEDGDASSARSLELEEESMEMKVREDRHNKIMSPATTAGTHNLLNLQDIMRGQHINGTSNSSSYGSMNYFDDNAISVIEKSHIPTQHKFLLCQEDNLASV